MYQLQRCRLRTLQLVGERPGQGVAMTPFVWVTKCGICHCSPFAQSAWLQLLLNFLGGHNTFVWL